MKNRIDIKKLVIWLISAAFIIGAVIVAIIFRNGSGRAYQKYNDGVNYIDPDTIQLSDSSVTVSFSEVIFNRNIKLKHKYIKKNTICSVIDLECFNINYFKFEKKKTKAERMLEEFMNAL